MHVPRKSFVTSAAAVAGALWVRFPGNAAEFSLKFATEWPIDFYNARFIVDAIDRIKHDTNGRVDIQLFASSTLGGQSQMLTQIRGGAIDFITAADFVLASVVPVAGIFGLPFIFTNEAAALAATKSPIGAYRLTAIAQAGTHPFEQSWNSGFRQVLNQIRPIATPDDIHGLKIRTPESQMVTATFKALGASPTPLTAGEMYTGLQTHIIDGLEVPLPAVAPYKLYEVLKYGSYTNHIWSSYTMLANAQTWQTLPKAAQNSIAMRINEAGARSNAGMKTLEAGVEETLRGDGITFNKADIPAFRAVIARSGLYAQWRNDYGSAVWSMLEKSTGPLV